MVGGGNAPQWKHTIGAENVARVLAAIIPPLVRIGVLLCLASEPPKR